MQSWIVNSLYFLSWALFHIVPLDGFVMVCFDNGWGIPWNTPKRPVSSRPFLDHWRLRGWPCCPWTPLRATLADGRRGGQTAWFMAWLGFEDALRFHGLPWFLPWFLPMFIIITWESWKKTHCCHHARLLVRAVLGNHHFEQPPSIIIPFLKIFEIGRTDTEKDERPLRNYSRGLDNIFGIIHNGGVQYERRMGSIPYHLNEHQSLLVGCSDTQTGGSVHQTGWTFFP